MSRPSCLPPWPLPRGLTAAVPPARLGSYRGHWGRAPPTFPLSLPSACALVTNLSEWEA